MILQALTKLYEDLAEQGKLDRPGWSPAKISYALCIDADGSLVQAVTLFVEAIQGKKTVLRPQMINLPAAVKRASNVSSNFLWDNAAYILGIDAKGKPQRAKQCFDACRELHNEILGGVDTVCAKAILRFFDKWQTESAAQHPLLADCMGDLLKGGNLLFRVAGQNAQDDPLIRQAWDFHYGKSEGTRMQCLVTGRTDTIEPIHPAIKGVNGAQSVGAALVSFNAPAFCSYGAEQNFNAPVGKYAAFAYTAALN